MIKRESLLSEAYFDKRLVFIEQAVSEFDDGLRLDATQFIDAAGAYYVLGQYTRSLFIARYSRGYPIEDLRDILLLLIDTWEKQKLADENKMYDSHFKDDVSFYEQALWMLVWSGLLGIEKEDVERVVSCIGNDGKDLLFERLIANLLPDASRKPCNKLVYPKIYGVLNEAIDAVSTQQPQLLQNFLQNWYGKMRSADWHDAHKGPEGGGFDGYWCWEAAGVAVAFGIDDSSFRDNRYYPKDLADFARAGE